MVYRESHPVEHLGRLPVLLDHEINLARPC